MGMISALIVGPCVAAPLAGVLLFISQTGNVVLGGVALFALAWGQGVLLLVVGGSSGALLPKAGAWMDGVKRLFGMLLFATAWWMVGSVVPPWLATLGWGALGLWCAVMLGAFEPIAAEAGQGAVLRKAAGLLLALWSALVVVGLAAGGHDVWQPLRAWRPVSATPPSVAASSAGTTAAPAAASGPLANALSNNGLSLAAPAAKPGQFTRVASSAGLDALLANTTRPVMLDFYADWCVSCIEMEKFTFSDPHVAAQMSRFLLVQADVTKNNADDRALLKRFHLFGPPGIMFFDAHGKLVADARVVGFQDARQFSAVLDRVLEASGK
jgi:thiol:disulfide interchange protein DsbD